MSKRILASILAALMLLATLASCGETASDGGAAVTTASSADSSAESEAAAEARLEPDLPDADFGGYDFRVITRGASSVHWISKDIYAAEQNGDVINDAVFLRNSRIGEKYNFTISEEGSFKSSEMFGAAKKTILAGEDVYDMLAFSLTSDWAGMAQSGYLVDLNEMPYMDLDQPWYDQNSRRSLSILHHLYAVHGDMLVMDDEATMAVLFNKQMTEDYDLGDFYGMVSDGAWTLDNYYNAITAVSRDLDGDGAMTDVDQYGVISELFSVYGYIASTGETIAKKDKDDVPYLTAENERFITAFEKSIRCCSDFNVCMFVENFRSKYPQDTVWSDCMDKAFSDGRVLFNCAGLVRVVVFRAMDIDFGILPMPMLDEAQESICEVIDYGCTDSIMIPVTASDLDRTGLILEALSAESTYTLRPAFYDVTLKTKMARDDESAAMIDLILDNRVYDLGDIFGWGNISDSIQMLTMSKSPDIASTIASGMVGAQAALERSIAYFEELDG